MPFTLKIAWLDRAFIATSAVLFLTAVPSQSAQAQALNLELPCQRSAMGQTRVEATANCQEYIIDSEEVSSAESSTNLELQPETDLEGTNQTIRVRLALSGPDNEWIRIETSSSETGATTLRAYHTTRVRRTLLSEVTTNLLSFGLGEVASDAIDGFSGSVPIPDINFHRWANHETQGIAFVPDGCSETFFDFSENAEPIQSGCAITGTDSIRLPAGTDIHAGFFTIQYVEEELTRSITFRVPPEQS